MSDIDTSAAHAASTAGLGRKVGPLPIWGWAVLLIGGVALFLYIRSRSSGTVADNNGAGLSSTTDQTAAGALSSMYGTSGSGYTSSYSNNQAYEQAAISELSGSTQYSPLQIQTALGKLFSGDQLSTSDQSIINKIESSLGAPPEYVPTPTAAPTQTTTPTPPAATYDLPNGTNNTLVWILGQAGQRRGGLYAVNGNQATFTGSVAQPTGVPIVSDPGQIAQLQSEVNGLK